MSAAADPDNTAAELQRTLDALAKESRESGTLLICRNPELLAAVSLPSGIIVAADVQDANQLELSARYAVVVVIDQLELMPINSGLALLARLRDCHSDDVFLHIANDYLTGQELLALGYMPTGGQNEGRWFRYQREQFYEERTWNTPEQWAHPENFLRKRW